MSAREHVTGPGQRAVDAWGELVELVPGRSAERGRCVGAANQGTHGRILEPATVGSGGQPGAGHSRGRWATEECR